MLQATKRIPQGGGLAQVLIQRSATVTLDWDQRQKSRFDCQDSEGRRVGVFLPRGTLLRGGDMLLTLDGTLLRVVAAPQSLLRITPCAEQGSPFDLLRAAYHLGNRHVPIELQPDQFKIEPDHVLADMLVQMGLVVEAVEEAFEPEAGAYGEHATMGHSHGHGHHHHDGGDHQEGGHEHSHDGHGHEH